VTEFDSKLSDCLHRFVPQFQQLVKAERLSGGASQETYRLTVLVGGVELLLAMRRAPGGADVERTAGYPGLDVEALLMQAALAASVPAPTIQHVLSESDGLGEGFIMEWLGGETLGARIVKIPALDEIRPRLAFECGEVLARIHAIKLESFGLDKKLLPITPKEHVEQTLARYLEYHSPQPMIDYTGRWLLDNLPQNYTPALVHTDYRNGNIMVSPEGVEAVLDWELAHIGDPMRDLGWICTNSWRFGHSELPVGGFGSYDDFFSGYESVCGVSVNRDHVKFWEIFGSFWWAVTCLGMADHYRNGPDKSIERAAIGRRSSEGQIDCVNLLMPGLVELVTNAPSSDDVGMPRVDELLVGVKDFLQQQVMAETGGRTNFMARVAANSVSIVVRELELGPQANELELDRLQSLLGEPDSQSILDLRWQLCRELNAGSISLESEELQRHLRFTVANQVAIDQPKYSGLQTALNT
jgi:aminoglycoside phosphotransferase (APT) family kinase protein